MTKKLGRDLLLPPHPQIDPVYTVCEKWTKNLGRALPPPHLDKIQKEQQLFFVKPSLLLKAYSFIHLQRYASSAS